MSEDTDTPQEIETLPLDAWHRRKGARMVPFAGYEMPIQYEGIVAEHNWVREQAGLFDVSHMGQLTVTGDKAAEELEKLLPGAITSLKPGRTRYSLLMAEDGGILDDLMVTNSTEWIEADEEAGTEGHWGNPEYYLVVNGATKWDDIAHLREHLPDDITMTHLEDQALIALQGPLAAQALTRVMRGVPESLTFMQSTEHQFGEWPLRITRAGYTGEDGFEISVPNEHAENLADRLMAEAEIRPAGLGARDSLRLEAGLPLYGHDLSDTIDPVSADLLFAVTKKRRETGGFKGHDRIVEMLGRTSGLRRVGMTLDGRLPAREGATIHIGDNQVGHVTSGGFSPTLGHPVAMGYVEAEHAAHGTVVEIEVRGRRLPATVAPMPFVPHRYYRGS